MASNWPITKEDVVSALGLPENVVSTQLGPSDLAEIALACSNRVDGYTGRRDEPTLHEVDGKVPAEFRIAAMDLAATWWRQTRNGPRTSPTNPSSQPGDVAEGIRGIGWPRRARAMLEDYQALPGFA